MLTGIQFEGHHSLSQEYHVAPVGDLIVSATSLPSYARPGTTLTLSATTRNAGRTTVGTSRTRFFLSRNTVLDSGDIPLGSTNIVSLTAGASASVSKRERSSSCTSWTRVT